MKRYRYIGTEEQLVKHGFSKCGYGMDRNEIYICLETCSDTLWFYQRGAVSFDDVNRDYDTDITHYIQDLIDDGLVEVLS